jgi:hypothetical protein
LVERKYKAVERKNILKKFCSQQTGEEALEKRIIVSCNRMKDSERRENIPVSASTDANCGNGVALNTDLGRDGADDGTHKASEDVVRSGGSRRVEGSAALDRAAIAATVDDRGSQRRGGEGSGDEDSNFGKHRE